MPSQCRHAMLLYIFRGAVDLSDGRQCREDEHCQQCMAGFWGSQGAGGSAVWGGGTWSSKSVKHKVLRIRFSVYFPVAIRNNVVAIPHIPRGKGVPDPPQSAFEISEWGWHDSTDFGWHGEGGVENLLASLAEGAGGSSVWRRGDAHHAGGEADEEGGGGSEEEEDASRFFDPALREHQSGSFSEGGVEKTVTKQRKKRRHKKLRKLRPPRLVGEGEVLSDSGLLPHEDRLLAQAEADLREYEELWDEDSDGVGSLHLRFSNKPLNAFF